MNGVRSRTSEQAAEESRSIAELMNGRYIVDIAMRLHRQEWSLIHNENLSVEFIASKRQEFRSRAIALLRASPSGFTAESLSDHRCVLRWNGKSHLIEARDHLAIDKGRIVAWHTLETLEVLVRRHCTDDSINKRSRN